MLVLAEVWVKRCVGDLIVQAIFLYSYFDVFHFENSFTEWKIFLIFQMRKLCNI